eukprot:TRINITY_DN10449_c0_g1_i1.p1 TRINITY_DN10449_c0_g1~~TRINITY_DN10449_c0_g1_i1.p1  ORF type:complete len:504 (-),score=74.64 TRINITY_DN10449_c0_g1_i1:474-1985(-)
MSSEESKKSSLSTSGRRRLQESNWRSIKAIKEEEDKVAEQDTTVDDGAAHATVESPLLERTLLSNKRKRKKSMEVENSGSDKCRIIELPRIEGKRLAYDLESVNDLRDFLESYRASEGLSHLKPAHASTLRVDLHRKQSLTSERQYWLDIMYPTEKSLDILADMLGLHPLTVEDCLGHSLFKMARTHRQKVEAYENYVFLASSEVQNGTAKATSNTLSSHDLFCAVFPNLIITFHAERLICIQEARERLAKTINDVIDEGLHPTVEWILYSLLDAIIDQQGTMIELLESEAATLDDLILNAGANDQLDFMHRILSARRRCSYLQRELEEKLALLSALTSGHARRAVGGHDAQISGDQGKYIMVGEKLVSPDDLFQAIFEVKLSEDIRLHLRDVVSNIESMQVTLENTSDSIANTAALYLNRVNIQLAEGSNEMTQAQKFFAAIATIGLSLGLVATAWGQNTGVPGGPPKDGVYPDLRWWFGILGGLLAFAVIVLIIFWRIRWL